MKIMFLLRGAQASGKSTFINNAGVGKIVSTDTIRRNLGGLETQEIDGRLREVIAFNIPLIKATFAEAHRLTDEYCKAGEIVFIDALNIVQRSTREFVRIAQRHDYKVFYVDIQGDTNLEELYRRNDMRPEASYTSRELIRASHARHLELVPINDIDVITPEAALKLIERGDV